MASSLLSRVERLETTARPADDAPCWYDIEFFKRDCAEELTLNEREAWRLAEFPECADEIRKSYAGKRERMARNESSLRSSGFGEFYDWFMG